MRAIGYVRVSTGEQGESGAGVAAQERAIGAEAKRRGWDVSWIEDTASGTSARRPGLQRALGMLAAREADALIVDKVDRLSRSLLDFASILASARRQGWSLLALGAPADPTTAQGEAMAAMLGVFAQFEARLISDRTKRALAEKRVQGVRLGRPRSLPDAIRDRIKAERAEGASLQLIADRLNVEEVPTAQAGARSYSATVRAIAKAAG
jgi:DNA invertase Pin-like site-specific DNA recombinase